jgi:hypothetical protein
VSQVPILPGAQKLQVSRAARSLAKSATGVIRAAGEALIHNHRDTHQDLRTDAIARAWTSADLTVGDRRRVALLVADELDEAGKLGIVAGPDRALHEVAATNLPNPDDPRLQGLTLNDLLAAG